MHRVGLALLLVSAALAQEPKFDSAAVARGASEFKSTCGFCHGDDATGNRAPDLIRSASLGHDVNGEVVGPIIRNGRPEKGMPPFATLSEKQIADIVQFLHKQAFEALRSNSVPRDYPLKKLLTGNAEAGRAYFNGAGGCASCHSVTGDLKGVASKYVPLDLQQRFLYPAGAGKRTATVTLPNGQKFEGPVVEADEFNISITGKDGWYHSWPRDQVKVEIRDTLAGHRALMEKYTDQDIHNVFAYLETLK